MAAKRTRAESRERLRKIFETELDRLVPADAFKMMKGRTFRDFEMQGITLKEALVPALLEELSGLDESAEVAAVVMSALQFGSDLSGEGGGEEGGAIAGRTGGPGKTASALPCL